VKTIVMPKENEVQVKEDLKREQLGDLEIRYVENVDQVISLVLEPPKGAKKVAPKASKRARRPRGDRPAAGA
jgi:predicted ATP-dependent protease